MIYPFASTELCEFVPPVLDATEPNELSGWNCPCFAACDEMAEGSNLRKICEKDCAKTCKS